MIRVFHVCYSDRICEFKPRTSTFYLRKFLKHLPNKDFKTILNQLLASFLFNLPVNSYGHVGTVSSPNHIFFLGELDLAVNQYFMYILSLVSDKLFHDPSPCKAGMEHATPGSAVRHATDCTRRPGTLSQSM